MAFWEIDLTTRAGARGAAHTAGTAAFVYAGATVLGALIGGAMVQTVNLAQTSLNVLPIVLAALAAFAGFRLQDGKGMIIGSVLAVIVALDLLAHVLALQGYAGLVLCGVVLALLVQGLRGVRALHQGRGFEDDDIETFG